MSSESIDEEAAARLLNEVFGSSRDELKAFLSRAFGRRILREIECHEAEKYVDAVASILSEHDLLQDHLKDLLADRRPDEAKDITRQWAARKPQPQLEKPPQGGRTRVLFLGANPINTERFRFDRELNRIKAVIEGTKKVEDRVSIEEQLAVQPTDLHRLFMQHEPHWVHISAHGSRDGGFILEDATGRKSTVALEWIDKFFQLPFDRVKCVFLSACYTDTLASRLVGPDMKIDVVVGMEGEVIDDSVIEFVDSFYQALAHHKSVADAFEIAKHALGAKELNVSIHPENGGTNVWLLPGPPPPAGPA